jgi:F420-non-reducing hydrogenase small subunit
VDVSYCPLLIDQGDIGQVDVAVVDGAVRVKEDEEKLAEVRAKSRYLVAWGTCASFGGIPAMANQYPLEDLIEESYGQTEDPFTHYLSGTRGLGRPAFQGGGLELLRRAGKLDDHVKVDFYIPGCPALPGLLVNLVKELRGERQLVYPRQIVCVDCNRKPLKGRVDCFWVFPRPEWEARHCFSSRGALCMGFLTRGGCGALCPRGGLPCWGCRGPSEVALGRMSEGASFEQVVLGFLVRRCRLPEDKIGPVMRIIRSRANSSLNFYESFAYERSRIR